MHVLRQKIKVFYCDSSTSHKAKSLRQKIKVIYYVPSAKLLRKNKTVHPLKLKWKVLELSLMDSFCLTDTLILKLIAVATIANQTNL